MGYEDIRGLDVRKGLAIVSNNKTIYLKLLKSFLNNDFCNQIVGAVDGGNLEQVRLSAHSLKGVAGNLHMEELYEISRLIESDAREGAAVNVGDDNIARLIEVNKQVLESIGLLTANPEILDSI